MALTEFKKIDAGLNIYYQSFGRNDYVNSDGVGKFLQFCIENELEEDDIDDELNPADPSESIYIEFDDNFPIRDEIKDETEKQTEILKVIKHCYGSNGTSNILMNQLEMQLNNDEYIIFKGILSDQCKVTCIKTRDELFWYGLCVGLKNKFPFLQYLASAYNIAHVENTILKNKINFKLANWINNNVIQAINYRSKTITIPNSKKYAIVSIDELIFRAINVYMERLMNVFILRKSGSIKDDINDVVKQLTDSCVFFKSIVENNHNVYPFQFDVVIALNATNEGYVDDSDSDSDSDDEKENNINQINDFIGDIHINLKETDCAYYCNDGKMSFTKTYDQFLKIMNAKYKNKATYMNNYPHKRRLVAFLDKRNKIGRVTQNKLIEVTNNNINKLTFFEPVYDYRNFPNFQKNTQHVPEWNIESILQCIIPNVLYPNNPKLTITTKTDQNVSNFLNKKTARDSCNGKILIFSFHVESTNRIRCYMWWRAKCVMFLPKYIQELLPKMFENSKKFKFDQYDKCFWKDEIFENICQQLKQIN
eukprot:201125_1